MFDELTIDSIAARAVLVPMPRPLRTAAGDVPAAPLVLVDVQTSEGIVGRSYAFAYSPLMLRTLVQFLDDVAPALVGQPVSPRERMRQLDAQLKLMGMQWFPRGMANAIAAEASDLAMVDMIKIGGVTGWISAAGQAEAASLPLSSHSYIEASAHAMACSPSASWCEYLDLAGAVLTEPLIPDEGKITARGPGLGLEWDEKAVDKYAFR